MTPLRQRMLEDMQLRNLGTETQRSYLHYITGLARFYQTSPELLAIIRNRRFLNFGPEAGNIICAEGRNHPSDHPWSIVGRVGRSHDSGSAPGSTPAQVL